MPLKALPAYTPTVMGFSPPPDSAEEALLKRIGTLLAQLDDGHPHTPEYDRLSAEIRELALEYAKLAESRLNIEPPDPKP